jgi:hypothetical protein
MEDQWDFVDEMLFLDRWLPAVVFVRDSTSCRLNDALDAVDSRKQKRGIDFNGSALARVTAFASFDKITEPICVIEGSWDGDTLGWFIRLSAITEQSSVRHPRYTDHGLCVVRGLQDQVKFATALGEELARIAGTPFYLTSVEIDDRTRWWDTQPETAP